MCSCASGPAASVAATSTAGMARPVAAGPRSSSASKQPGEIVAKGPRVTLWHPGDRVTSIPRFPVAPAHPARPAKSISVKTAASSAYSPLEYKQHGAFAEFVAVPDRILYRLPDTLPFDQAAMVEPLPVAITPSNVLQSSPPTLPSSSATA